MEEENIKIVNKYNEKYYNVKELALIGLKKLLKEENITDENFRKS